MRLTSDASGVYPIVPAPFADKLPVNVGVSAPGFAAMHALTREVMERGAAGMMIAPPHTLRSEDQIVTNYQQQPGNGLRGPKYQLQRLARHDARARLA